MARHPNSKNPVHNPGHPHHLPDPATVTDLDEHQKHTEKAIKLAKDGHITLSDFQEEQLNDKQDRLSVIRTHNG